MEIQGLHGMDGLGAANCSDFGPVYHQFHGKPKEAIRHLMKTQTGEVPGAFYHSEVGEIDLVWGEYHPENQNGFGLKKIIEKHGHEFQSWGLKIEEVLPTIIQGGIVNRKLSSKKHIVLEHRIFRGVVKLDWNEKRKQFLMTAYEKKLAGLSGSPTSDSPGFIRGDEMAVLHPAAIGKDTKLIPSLGAEEILRANAASLDCKGYRPHYAQLESYAHLIDKTDLRATPGSIIRYGQGGLKQSLEVITDYIRTYAPQVRRLALHLNNNQPQTTNYKQLAFNIWHFCKTNIHYAYDAPGKEQLRTPARSWNDRLPDAGIDCDDFSIFIASLLQMLSIPWRLKIVAFNGKENYSHIYVILPRDGGNFQNGTITLDAVLNSFDDEPPGITKYFTMNSEELSGFIHPIISFALGAVENDSTVAKMRVKLQQLEQRSSAGNISYAEATDLRKLRALLGMVNLAETDAAGTLLQLMPHIKDVTAEGVIVWHENALNQLFAGEIEEAQVSAQEQLKIKPVLDILQATGLGEIDDEETLDAALDCFSGLGRKTKAQRKERRKKIGAFFKKVGKGFMKINPATAALRGIFLGAVALNLAGLATNIAKAVKTNRADKVKKIFEGFGGKWSRLVDVANKNAHKKPLFKKKKDLKGPEGLGFAVETALATASSIIVPIIAALKKALGKDAAEPEAADTEGKAALQEWAQPAAEGELSPFERAADMESGAPATANESTGGNAGKWLAGFVLLTAAAAGIAYASSKPKRKTA